MKTNKNEERKVGVCEFGGKKANGHERSGNQWLGTFNQRDEYISVLWGHILGMQGISNK